MKLELDVPECALTALRREQADVGELLRLMAAVKLYEVGQLSQERAAELAGLDRSAFLRHLSLLGVSPFQEVEADIAGAQQCSF